MATEAEYSTRGTETAIRIHNANNIDAFLSGITAFSRGDTVECIKEFVDLRPCSSTDIEVKVSDRDAEYWRARRAMLCIASASFILTRCKADMVKLGDKLYLVLSIAHYEDDAEIGNEILREVQRYLGVSLPIRIETVASRHSRDCLANVIVTPDGTYVFIGTSHPLPVYVSDKLVVMAYATRASILSDEEEHLVEEYNRILNEIRHLLHEAEINRVRIPNTIYKHIASIFSPNDNYDIMCSKVALLEGETTKEQILKEIREALKKAEKVIPKLKEKIAIKKLLG
jgi:hypothetical protein